MADDLQSLRSSRAQLLLRVPPNLSARAFAQNLGVADSGVEPVPLCPNTDTAPGVGLAANHRWYVTDLGATGFSNSELWEAAHQANQSPHMAAAGSGAFVEPDLVQEWPYTNLVRPANVGAAPGELCAFNNQDASFPTGPDFAWHLRDDFSQLRKARQSLGTPGSNIRIGILDVGFDLQHQTLPKGINLTLARNFVADGQGPTDVHDPYQRGLFNNPGHGTGTIGLLAGNLYQNPLVGTFNDYLGGAPLAEIVPIRMATSVILFRTSAFASGLDYLIAPNGDAGLRADVVSMSMGGLASRAWADVVNHAYEMGITLVTAAGNNYPLTPSLIAFPALFRRVIAACGVMADGRPYTRDYVPFGKMAGNYGPPSKMASALSAYTPNTSWAEVNCKAIVDMDGAGTSSATPQIAAAAALWLQKYKAGLTYPNPWGAVEAVRHALFTSAAAAADPAYAEALGRGMLRAADALSVSPLANPIVTPPDTATFALLRGLFGMPAAGDAAHEMLELELTQVVQQSPTLAKTYVELGMTGGILDDDKKRRLIEEVVSHTDASPTLKSLLKGAYPAQYVPTGGSTASSVAASGSPPRIRPPSIPYRRRLQGYAFDPQLSTEYATAAVNRTTYSVPWEESLQPGPCGEYVDVVDIDPASGGFYQPVNLNQPSLLADDGVTPSEGNPQFHQQMVYAVAMRTIENFELALGRRVQWSPRMQGADDSYFVRQLRIYPHAFRQRNAYYDPSRKALLFGYFPAGNDDPGRVYPGGMVFTCLSHDIVAHETTHAILDGLHRGLLEPSNADVLAFHEAFADLMALLQHFSLPKVLEQQIARARGDLRARNLLGELAMQFGEATGRYGALRSAIGRVNAATHEWEPLQPDASLLDQVTEPHDRGAILVAAVFDAFLTIYERRTEDLIRIATAGSGVLPAGALHPDLVSRLATEAGHVANQVLRICIRAIDYCPPVDLTFGDYLRALITADTQLVVEDPLQYRIAFVDAFRRRGIYPKGLRSISADALLWDAPSPLVSDVLRDVMVQLQPLVDAWAHIDPAVAGNRADTFTLMREWRKKANHYFRTRFESLTAAQFDAVTLETGLDLSPGNAAFEVRSLQLAQKISPNQYAEPQVLVALVQQHRVSLNGSGNPGFMFKGGCTIVADVRSGLAQYIVRKNIGSSSRLASEQAFRMSRQESLAGMYFGHASLSDNARTFALLHGLEGGN